MKRIESGRIPVTEYSATIEAGAPDIRVADIHPNRVTRRDHLDLNIGVVFENCEFIYHNSSLVIMEH